MTNLIHNQKQYIEKIMRQQKKEEKAEKEFRSEIRITTAKGPLYNTHYIFIYHPENENSPKLPPPFKWQKTGNRWIAFVDGSKLNEIIQVAKKNLGIETE